MKNLPTTTLSDAQLVAEVKRLVRGERDTVAELVVHLAEMDSRPIHLAAGFPSLYMYCLEELHLSGYEAYHRIEVARAGKAFPQVFRLLAEGALSMTAAQLLARRLTAENHDELLRAAAGRTKREVQVLLARHFPQPDAPATVRKLPQPKPIVATETSNGSAVVVSGSVSPHSPVALTPVPAAQSTPSNYRPVVTLLAPDRYRVTFTADAETCDLLAQAKDMLRHAVPSGDTADVMKRALKALLKDLARRKFAAMDKPRKSDVANGESAARSGPSRRPPQRWSTEPAGNGSAQAIQRHVVSTTTQRPFW